MPSGRGCALRCTTCRVPVASGCETPPKRLGVKTRGAPLPVGVKTRGAPLPVGVKTRGAPLPGYRASRHHETTLGIRRGAVRHARCPNFLGLFRNANTRLLHAKPTATLRRYSCPSSSTTTPLLKWLTPMTARTSACGWRCPMRGDDFKNENTTMLGEKKM